MFDLEDDKLFDMYWDIVELVNNSDEFDSLEAFFVYVKRELFNK